MVIPLINNAIGVIDHCTFITFALHSLLYFNNGNWNNQGQPDAGDGSWTAPVNWGSSAFTFIEDCEFIHNGTGLCAITDAYAGARFVIRHNTIFNGQVQTHGTESTGRARGVRAVEIYNNTFTATAGHGTTVGAMRSGNVLMHDNTATGYGATVMGLNNMRNIDGFIPWGAANGTNGFDVNDTTGGPNHDGIYFTGTAATASNCTGECTMTVTGANFTVNQWKGVSDSATY